MHLFFSVGEPSGDQHAAHLIEELKRRRPDLRISGFGGPHMEHAGCRLLYQLTNLAVMGILPVLPLLWRFYKLVKQADRFLQEERPDAVILVDFPGFNWHIARKAKAAGIPVFYFLPPQLWAWAPWRIKRMQKYVDHVLSALPFEKEWYEKRGVAVEYVGHPIFDEVAARQLDASFEANSPRPIVALLPGSRNREVTANWPIMLDVARRLHAQMPGVQFLVASYKDSQRQMAEGQLTADDRELPLRFHVGKTPEIIAKADCCLMVSGSVSLELLARGTPAAVLYRPSLSLYLAAKLLVKCKYMSLPNLMAGRPIMPEFICRGEIEGDVGRITDLLVKWLKDSAELARVRQELADLRREVAAPGAVGRAATSILQKLESEALRKAA